MIIRYRTERFALMLACLVAVLMMHCTQEYGGVGTPEVETLHPFGINSGGAKAGGKVITDHGNPSNSFGLLLSSWDDFRKVDSLQCAMKSTGEFTVDLTGLKHNQTIYLKAWATNVIGTGYGQVVIYSHQESGITFNPDLQYDNLVDIDGNQYRTIQIGSQHWMAENLKTTRYNDGTPIPHIVDNKDWAQLDTPAYSWYLHNEAGYKNTYGALYNWWVVSTGKLCPLGWHVPDSSEFDMLINQLGGEVIAGSKLKEVGSNHWLLSNNATNESGFTALPGGYRANSGRFDYNGFIGYLWSVTPDLVYTTRSRFMILYSTVIVCTTEYSTTRQAGLSVRCISD